MTMYLGDQEVAPIVPVPTPATKYGVSIDNILGNVDANGAYQLPTEPFTLDLSVVKSVPSYGLYYAFYGKTNMTGALTIGIEGMADGGYYLAYAFAGCNNITSVDLSTLISISNSNYAMQNCFYNCFGLTSVDLSSLTTVSGSNNMAYCFYNCLELTAADLSSLTTVNGYNSMASCFGVCKKLTSVDLSSLTTVKGYGAMSECFRSCEQLATISFPALASIENNCFGDASYSYTFIGCTALTEIHFPSNMQSQVEQMTGYADKWGATNATIYFDLPSTAE